MTSDTRKDTVARLTRSEDADGHLQDQCRCLTVEASSDSELCLRGTLPAGRFEMTMLTADGSFDPTTVMLTMREWPSYDEVLAGPFDFNHMEYRMAVPVFRLYLNGEDRGLVWCEVPSPGDVASRRIRAMWGFETLTDGPCELRLVIPEEDRARLRWSDLACVSICHDDRYSLDPPLDNVSLTEHPRLFGNAEAMRRLAETDAPASRAILERLRANLNAEDKSTYGFRTAKLAIIGRLYGEEELIRDAIKRTLALCEEEGWGYHNHPDIMGWNSDRDTGNRMYETALVFDWLYDHLTPEERKTIQAKLAHHAAIAYRITLIQKNYWYYRCNEAHGQGLWFGLAAASLALLGHDDAAHGWLAWTLGNFDDAMRHLPADGILSWSIFNATWHLYTLILLERSFGTQLAGPYPFLQGFAEKITGFVSGEEGFSRLGVFLSYLASRHGDARAQADAFAAFRLSGEGTWNDGAASGRLDPMAVFAFDPSIAPAEPTVVPSTVHSLSGTVVCRSACGYCFTFQCGTPMTPEQHESFNFLNRCWCNLNHAGTFSWSAHTSPTGGGELTNEVVLSPLSPKGYRTRTADTNSITIDGVGSHHDGRYMGYTIPLEDVPHIEYLGVFPEVTFCRADLTPGYQAHLGVERFERRWIFLHSLGMLILHDRVRCKEEHDLAWHMHGVRGRWELESPLLFRSETEGKALAVRALASRTDEGWHVPSPTDLTCERETSQIVPTYTQGLNLYKTLDWQPELRPESIDIPPFEDLRFAPTSPTQQWDLLTVMGPDAELLALAGTDMDGGAVVVSVRDALKVTLADDSPVCLDGGGLHVEAEVVVEVMEEATVTSFATRRIVDETGEDDFNGEQDCRWRRSRGGQLNSLSHHKPQLVCGVRS